MTKDICPRSKEARRKSEARGSETERRPKPEWPKNRVQPVGAEGDALFEGKLLSADCRMRGVGNAKYAEYPKRRNVGKASRTRCESQTRGPRKANGFRICWYMVVDCMLRIRRALGLQGANVEVF